MSPRFVYHRFYRFITSCSKTNSHKGMCLPHNPNHRRRNKYAFFGSSIVIAKLDIHVTPLRVPQILQIYHELFHEQPPQGNASPPSQPEPQTVQQVCPFRVIYRHSQPQHSRHPASCTTDLSWAVPRPTPTGQCASALTT